MTKLYNPLRDFSEPNVVQADSSAPAPNGSGFMLAYVGARSGEAILVQFDPPARNVIPLPIEG